jgi:hypothetical protein
MQKILDRVVAGIASTFFFRVVDARLFGRISKRSGVMGVEMQIYRARIVSFQYLFISNENS